MLFKSILYIYINIPHFLETSQKLFNNNIIVSTALDGLAKLYRMNECVKYNLFAIWHHLFKVGHNFDDFCTVLYKVPSNFKAFHTRKNIRQNSNSFLLCQRLSIFFFSFYFYLYSILFFSLFVQFFHLKKKLYFLKS